MLKILLQFFDQSALAVEAGVDTAKIASSEFFRRLSRMAEEIGEDQIPQFEVLCRQMEQGLAALRSEVNNAV